MEQKEATAEKVSEAIQKFSYVLPNASLLDFGSFVSLCSGKDLENHSIERLKESNLCSINDNRVVELTDEGKRLQFAMGLQTKILNRRRIEGLEADTIMTEMLANLENL